MKPPPGSMASPTGSGCLSRIGRCCTTLRRAGPKASPRPCWATTAPGSGCPTATPDSRISPWPIRSVSPMSCATSNTPSIAATPSSPRKFVIISVGQSVSANDEQSSRTLRWSLMPPRQSAASTPCSPSRSLIQLGKSSSARSRRGERSSSSSSPIARSRPPTMCPSARFGPPSFSARSPMDSAPTGVPKSMPDIGLSPARRASRARLPFRPFVTSSMAPSSSPDKIDANPVSNYDRRGGRSGGVHRRAWHRPPDRDHRRGHRARRQRRLRGQGDAGLPPAPARGRVPRTPSLDFRNRVWGRAPGGGGRQPARHRLIMRYLAFAAWIPAQDYPEPFFVSGTYNEQKSFVCLLSVVHRGYQHPILRPDRPQRFRALSFRPLAQDCRPGYGSGG
ncbi:hypothetical protein PHAMO_470002 [Magnetospirillum molischianum DSM 120]|uniref:Uncharacterized protein n=1 Tax=Magnetospirillum molischianum DSM 120 TaxID=1150626 RepID=H8FWL4_MAGML|nr:hypothetical protein PHAMO_470002 [Magnetospirillum molischianum DSM 120]